MCYKSSMISSSLYSLKKSSSQASVVFNSLSSPFYSYYPEWNSSAQPCQMYANHGLCAIILPSLWSKNHLMLSQSACQLLHLLSNSLLPHLIAAQVSPSNQSHLQHAHLQSATVFWPQTHACPLPDCPLYCAQLSGISPRLFLTIGKQIMVIFLTYLHYSSFIKTVAKFEIAWR